MKAFLAKHVSHLKAKVFVPGDKSIAHRAIFLSAISSGSTSIYNFPASDDCLATVKVFRALGVKIIYRRNKHSLTVFGTGRLGLRKPRGSLFIKESGTTIRLLLGLLAGFDFKVTLIAGKALSQRPMSRVTEPLRMMGARIKAKGSALKEEFLPITIKGGNLKSITYRMKVASAQVKSAILLAGLYAYGKTIVIEPVHTRDHTERMLKLFKADLQIFKNKIVITGNNQLISPKKITIASDISSASFFIVLATIIPESEILIKNVSLNPSRAGILKVLKRMGASIKVSGCQGVKVPGGELCGDLTVSSSDLKATVVTKKEIPSLIDEIPVLMVAAAVANGSTVFDGVEELRVKETDRIRSMTENLKRMGVPIEIKRTARSEKVIIHGQNTLKGASVQSFCDHRTAMSMVVAGLKATGHTSIDDIRCINKSFPQFIDLIRKIVA